MKIAVFSDSHGNTKNMISAVLSWQPDLIVHLGDYEVDARLLAYECEIQVRSVRGNCDMASRAADSDLFELGGKRILMCHGHKYDVKYDLTPLLNAAHFSKADIVLYGHTHIAHLEEIEGMLVLNPGSCGSGSKRSWAKLILDNNEARAEIIPI